MVTKQGFRKVGNYIMLEVRDYRSVSGRLHHAGSGGCTMLEVGGSAVLEVGEWASGVACPG